MDLYFRRKLKWLEGEIKLLDLNKIEDSGIKNDFDLNYWGKMVDNYELLVDDGDEEMNY